MKIYLKNPVIPISYRKKKTCVYLIWTPISDCLKGSVIWFYEPSDISFITSLELLLSNKWYSQQSTTLRYYKTEYIKA